MIKSTLAIVLLGSIISLEAQGIKKDNCNNTSAGPVIGEKGCVNLTYQNKATIYETVRAADGNEWLLQNLGSKNVATSISDENARGDYFQFGRWDDGHQIKTSTTSTDYPNPNNPKGLGSGSELFFIGGGSPWTSDYVGWFANPNQNDKWEAKDITEVTEHNGIDPCKAIGIDWEIPTENDWDIVMQKEGIFPKPTNDTRNGITRAFDSNLKIAGAGARKEESFAFEGQRAYIWTKTASSNPNFYRYVYLGTATSSTTGFGGDSKSHGYSLRCVNKSNNSLGINNLTKLEFKIYPNPASTYINIISDNEIKKVEIVTYSGQIIQTDAIDKIDISKLAVGNYFIKVYFSNGQNQIKSFIKK